MKHFLKLSAVLFFVVLSLSAKGQVNNCDTDYAKACQDELLVANDIKLLDEQERVILARRKAAQCRLSDISIQKQKLIACMAANRNSIQLDNLQTKLLDILNELNKVKAQQQQPVNIPTPCLGGDCK
jgi:hypothetical protein